VASWPDIRIDVEVWNVASVDDLGLPPGWAPPRRLWTLVKAAAVLTLGVAAIGVGAILLARSEATVVDLAIALFGAGMVSAAHLLARPALPRARPRGVALGDDDGGVPVLHIRKPIGTRLIDAVGLLCIGGSLLLFWWSGALFDGWVGHVLLVVGVVLVLGSPLALVSSSEVELGSETILVRSGVGLRVEWDDIEAVLAVQAGDDRKVLLHARKIEPAADRALRRRGGRREQDGRGVEVIEVSCEAFAVDPVLLFHLLAYYHTEPAARPELGTPASLQRLHDAQFRST
jgi:hypothetical protein